jgi:RimJ/RimL family protein N-acetyltransferase
MTSKLPGIQIVLRDVYEDDVPIFFEYQSDSEANYRVVFTMPDPTDKTAFIEKWTKILTDNTIIKQTILVDDAVVGNLLCFEYAGKPSIGYWIGKAFWGKGITTIALRKFLELVSIRPLYAGVIYDNIASMRVLEKCGFTIIGTELSFANARNQEVKEYILKLD